ncbi:hypothetical protein [Virgibacillus sp. SK37]|uniref:hypothetical protein n=1 Tax=Virgibacillus sp. SK37 TaxID=403957 RepID=UPI0004D1620A|nr:hypothetical protein [Virgibacillus sp. SK37]AIF45638.1 hypothetical protein X953_18780 [Virgibacillus sp. SK37]
MEKKEVVYNYEIIKEENKQIVKLSPEPLYIEGRDGIVAIQEYYKEEIALIESGADTTGNERVKEYLDIVSKFTEPTFKGNVEIDNPDIEVHATPRTEAIKRKEKEIGVKYPSNLVWVDGANTSGVVVLDNTRYKRIYHLQGDSNDPNMTINYIEEYKEGMERPYFVKNYEENKTYVYVNHFSGIGTEAEPYYVRNQADLWNVREDTYAYYIQVNDIDMSYTHEMAPYTDGTFAGWTPINGFYGTYDGQGFTISNLYINRPSKFNIGLFGSTDRGAIIKNLILTNFDITCKNNGGALIGTVRFDSSKINNVHAVNVKITGQRNFIGGLIGEARTSSIISYIQNCSVSGSLTNTDDYAGIGGVVGRTNNITILNSYSNMDIVAEGSIIGGIVGETLSNTHVENCYSLSRIPNNDNAGGLLGYVTTSGPVEVINSYWDTEVSGIATSNGGGKGKTTAEMKDINTYVGWDFTNIWTMNTADGYPALILYNPNPLDPPDNGGDTGGGDTGGGGTDPNEPTETPADFFLHLIGGSKILKASVVYLENAGELSYPYFRVVTDSNIGVFKLRKMDEVDNPDNYPFRCITHYQIFLIETNEATN